MGALASGVSGLKSHQTMLDVTGNNLANVNTTGFKSSSVNFSELLSQTFRAASPPSGAVGGTNPLQIGSGVQLASVDKDMTQGTMVNTGQALDMAIEGAGYFTLNDGSAEVYTRVGLFDVDSNNFLVDAATGYRVQRIGSEGVADGFQSASSDNIRLPYDVALPANATTELLFTGNLSADDISKTTNYLLSSVQMTASGAVASLGTRLDDLDQYTNENIADTIDITGTTRSGTVVNTSFATYDGGIPDYKTVGDLLAAITAAFGGSSVSEATLSDGRIKLLDADSGYSQTDMLVDFTSGGGTSAFTMPNYMEAVEVGGELAAKANITMYDSLGVGHVGQVTYVRTDAGDNTWDMVINSLSGDVTLVDRRINGITFLTDGSYGGIIGGDTSSISLKYGFDPTNTRAIDLKLGTVGQYDGISLSEGSSTVALTSQDGYTSGWLSSIAITREGIISGRFTNDVRRDIAALKITTFQNPGGLEAVGSNYFTVTGNSGNPVATKGLAGSAGSILGGFLEQSNVEIAGEFVNLITAQNGFQANARTIRVANDMLKELTGLIR